MNYYDYVFGNASSIPVNDSALYHVGDRAKVKDHIRCIETGKIGKIVDLSTDLDGREKFTMEMPDGHRFSGFVDSYLECPVHDKGQPTMDMARKVYRKHPDKSPCYAKNEEDCPIMQHQKKAEEADDLHGSQTTAPVKVPSQEEMYDLYEKDGVSPELVAGIKAFHDAVKSGKAKPMRMPADVFSNADVPMWMIGAYYVASNYPDDETATRVLKDFAKASGAYLGDTLEYCTKNHGDSIGEGMESTVFDAGDNVVKASSLGFCSKEIMQRVERIMLGNKYFPETRNKVLGIGEDPMGDLSFVLEQPKVQFDEENPLNEEEIASYVKSRGFEMRDEFTHNCSSPDNSLACIDMHNENVVRTNDGDIVCIDPCVIPNVYELDVNHGMYDYDEPPESFK